MPTAACSDQARMVRRTRPNKGGRVTASCVQKTKGGTKQSQDTRAVQHYLGSRRVQTCSAGNKLDRGA
jgi:hypothetical protein